MEEEKNQFISAKSRKSNQGVTSDGHASLKRMFFQFYVLVWPTFTFLKMSDVKMLITL